MVLKTRDDLLRLKAEHQRAADQFARDIAEGQTKLHEQYLEYQTNLAHYLSEIDELEATLRRLDTSFDRVIAEEDHHGSH